MKIKVAVCIITYQRPNRLKRLLDGLNKLTFNKCDPPDLEIIIKEDVDFVALIDDDEVSEATWMDELLFSQKEYNVDVVNGKIIPYFPEEVPQWIIKGKFFAKDFYSPGYLLKQAASNKAISGNKNTSFREKSPKLGGFRGHKCGTFFQGNVLIS